MIVTSQDKRADLLLGAKTPSLLVDHMEPMEACRLLLWTALEPETDVQSLPPTTLQLALEISNWLECLALAVGSAWVMTDSWVKDSVELEPALDTTHGTSPSLQSAETGTVPKSARSTMYHRQCHPA